MYMRPGRVRDRVRMQGGCAYPQICYGVPMFEGDDTEEQVPGGVFGADEVDPTPYGVPLAAFLAEYPFVQSRVDVEMDRSPGAVPRIVIWLDAGARRLPVPPMWRGFQVDQRPPVEARPLGADEGETITAPQVDGKTDSDIPDGHAQEGGFPVGVAVVIFGVILGGFVLSFFVKQSPAGRWYLGGRRW